MLRNYKLTSSPNSNDGQYTQVVQGTVWTSTPTYVVSYISTQIVTLTSWIPCQVTTSYTTVYQCSSCGVIAPTACQPNLCATQINGVVIATSEPYASGQYASAYVTNNNGGVYTTVIAASQCTAYEQLTLANYDCNGLPSCTGGGGCTGCGPGPTGPLTCEAKPCTAIEGLNGPSYVTLTEGTSYAFSEYARLTVNGQVTSTPASLCAVLTTPAQWAIAPTCACGGDNNNVITSSYCTGGGGEVVTYTYTTQGSTIIVATTLPCRGGPFHLTGSAGSTVGGGNGRLLFYVWMASAIVAGVGMLVL